MLPEALAAASNVAFVAAAPQVETALVSSGKSSGQVPVLAYGTMSNQFGPKTMPTSSIAMMAGRLSSLKIRAAAHMQKRKSVTSSAKLKAKPAIAYLLLLSSAICRGERARCLKVRVARGLQPIRRVPAELLRGHLRGAQQPFARSAVSVALGAVVGSKLRTGETPKHTMRRSSPLVLLLALVPTTLSQFGNAFVQWDANAVPTVHTPGLPEQREYIAPSGKSRRESLLQLDQKSLIEILSRSSTPRRA